MIKPFGNEKIARETLEKIAAVRFQSNQAGQPVMSCYDHLARFLKDESVKGTDTIILMGHPQKDDAICHCALARDGDVIFDTNRPFGTIDGDSYAYSATKGTVNFQLDIKTKIAVADFIEQFQPTTPFQSPEQKRTLN